MILLIITKTITITVPIAIITMKFLCKNATEQLSAFLALLLHLEEQPGVHREAHLQQIKNITKLFSSLIGMKKVVPFLVPQN